MARPKKQLAVEEPTTAQPTRSKRNQANGPSQPTNSGITVNGSRKRKVAVVEPMPQPESVSDRAATTERRKGADAPLDAKRIKETLKKRTSRDKRVGKKNVKSNRRDNREPKEEPQVHLNVPKIPEESGELLSNGMGDTGQLGLGEDVVQKNRPTRISHIQEPVVDIAAGGMHSVCLTASGKVYTFGCNDEGSLGRVTEEEEENFEPGLVELPEKVVQVSAGDNHTAVLTEAGRVFIWGNFRDQSGLMGLLVGDRKETRPVQILQTVPCVSIASGAEHLVCLGLDGQIYTMGDGEHGQLGRLPQYFCTRGGRKGLDYILTPRVIHFKRDHDGQTLQFDRVWASEYCTFARERRTGTIYGCGLNNCKQLGPGKEEAKYLASPLAIFEGHQWKDISGGLLHVVALTAEGTVYSWGCNDYGRLGLGEGTTNQETPVLVPRLNDVRCAQVSCGNCASFAVSEDGVVYSWGAGNNCQLGHGSEDDVHEPKAVESKSMQGRRALRVSGGGQHTLILARPAQAAT